MTIPNIKYRVSRKKKHYNTCNNNNICIEQRFKNNTHSGLEILDKQDEARRHPPPLPPTSKCSLRLLGIKTHHVKLNEMMETTQTATVLISTTNILYDETESHVHRKQSLCNAEDNDTFSAWAGIELALVPLSNTATLMQMYQCSVVPYTVLWPPCKEEYLKQGLYRNTLL